MDWDGREREVLYRRDGDGMDEDGRMKKKVNFSIQKKKMLLRWEVIEADGRQEASSVASPLAG